jgi:Uma2 family endonuclease
LSGRWNRGVTGRGLARIMEAAGPGCQPRLAAGVRTGLKPFLSSPGVPMSTTTRVTAEQLLRMPDDGYRYELLAGELRKMTPANWRHATVVGDLHGLLLACVKQRNLGRLLVGDPGFLLSRDPDTVRAPDIAFIRRERVEAESPGEAFWPGAPDLAVEVVSPGDRTGEVDEKVRSWLDAGARMVWVVNPKWRSVTVYRSATDIRTLTENDELDGEDVVPGFRCRVADVFAGL